MEQTERKHLKPRTKIIIALLAIVLLFSLPFLLQQNKRVYVNMTSVNKGSIAAVHAYTGTLHTENVQTISFTDTFKITGISVKNGQRVQKGDVVATGYSYTSSGQKGAVQTLTADYSGIITGLATSVGESVPAGQNIMQIQDSSAPVLRVFAPPSDYAKLNIGMEAAIIVGSHTYNGAVSYISSDAQPVPSQPGTQNKIAVELTFLWENDAQKNDFSAAYIAQMEASAEIKANVIPDVLTLPKSAVKADDSGSYCYVIDVANRVEKRSFAPGDADGENIEIKSGLDKGEKIILNPSDQVQPGMTAIPK